MFTAAQDVRSNADAAVSLMPGRRVGVTRIVLTDFRNYREARLQLSPAPVVLTGANGAGKTNLLEALSLLAPGRGLRHARLDEFDRREPGRPLPLAGAEALAERRGWAIAATVETPRGAVRIGTGRNGPATERRIVRIDGEPVKSQTTLAERLGIVWLTPSMDRVFVEGAAGRRRFLDRLALSFDPAHAARVSSYATALRERARLLRDGPRDEAWLNALEEMMAREGIAVAAGRRDTAEQLDRACVIADGPFPRARLALAGAVEEWLGEMPALAAEERFAAALRENRALDAQTGGAAVGPHRCDLAVTYAEKGIPAETASTGEQKALLIAIVLAHARQQREICGDPPLLLLDEVAAHLDADRRLALFSALLRIEAQFWIAGTDPALFAPLLREAQFVSVRDGNLSAEFL